MSEKQDQASLDLYINCTQHVTLSCRGPSEVHLSGYFEPKGDDMDDDMFYGNEQQDDDEEDDDDDEEVDPKAAKKTMQDNLKQA